ncbi:hypothetical protein EJB05_15092, partial [Eragrostis curvula]
MCGAPAPSPALIEMMMRYYDATTTTKPAPVVEFADTGLWSTAPAAAEFADTGSWSAPSTPLDSSSETDASPHGGAMSAFYYHPEAAALASQQMMMPRQLVQQMMPVPVPYKMMAPPRPRVEVRQVWQSNHREEMALIESLLPRFRYAAVDTEFPGTVYRPACPAYLLTPEKRYALLKANVDELELIQLGLTLFNDDLTGANAAVVWEFNFREFDPRRHRHAPDSIAMLRAKGVDFDRAARDGVDSAAAFGPRLRKWLRGGAKAGLGRAGLVTFSGGYDMAYLVKAMFGAGYKLPATAAEFEAVAAALLRRRRVFDVKEMARRCPGADLRGGLDCVAAKLGVARAVGEAHQAGSDSLLTCHTFIKMKQRCFDDDDKLTKVAGMLTGITTS